MEVDNTTYNDLSVFHSEEEFSIFDKLDFTLTGEGKEWLYRFFKNPFSDVKLINETQQILSNVPKPRSSPIWRQKKHSAQQKSSGMEGF